MPRTIFGELEHDKPFQTFVGGIDLEQGLRKLDKPLAEIDSFVGADIPAKPIDRERRERFVAGQREFLGSPEDSNLHTRASEVRRFAKQTALDINNPLSEAGRTKLNYDKTVQLDAAETKRTQAGKQDSSDQLVGKYLREAQYNNEGGAGYTDAGGIFMPNEYKETFIAPDKIESQKIIKSYGEGFKDQVLQDGKGNFKIRAFSNPDNAGYIRDYFEKWSGVTGDRVKSYVAAQLMFDDRWRPRTQWEGQKDFVLQKAKELGSIEEASDYAIANPNEVQNYTQKYVESQAQIQAGLEAIKQTKIDIEKKVGTKADPTFGLKLKNRLDNAPGITMSVEGNLSKNVPVDLRKTKEALAANNVELKRLQNKDALSSEELQRLKGLEQQENILNGTLESYSENYIKTKEGRAEMEKEFDKFKGELGNTYYHEIDTVEKFKNYLTGKEKLADPDFLVEEGGENENTRQGYLDTFLTRLYDKSSEYAQDNPFSYKTEFISATGGIAEEASETIINGIQGGNFTVDGNLDASAFLEENFFKDKELSYNDFDITTRIGKERLHGEQPYQLILSPKTKEAKEKMKEQGTTSIMVYPKPGSSIHGQVGNRLMAQYADNFIDKNTGRLDHARALKTGVSAKDIYSGWRSIEEKQLYKDGLFMEADDKIGDRFTPVFEAIHRRKLEDYVTKNNPTAYINLKDTYDEGGQPVQVKIDRITRQKGGKTIFDYTYNLVNSEGKLLFSPEEVREVYGNDFKDGIMSLKDLETIVYLEDTF